MRINWRELSTKLSNFPNRPTQAILFAVIAVGFAIVGIGCVTIGSWAAAFIGFAAGLAAALAATMMACTLRLERTSGPESQLKNCLTSLLSGRQQVTVDTSSGVYVVCRCDNAFIVSYFDMNDAVMLDQSPHDETEVPLKVWILLRPYTWVIESTQVTQSTRRPDGSIAVGCGQFKISIQADDILTGADSMTARPDVIAHVISDLDTGRVREAS